MVPNGASEDDMDHALLHIRLMDHRLNGILRKFLAQHDASVDACQYNHEYSHFCRIEQMRQPS